MKHLICCLASLAFKTVADTSGDLNFLVMGDWGGTDHSPYTHITEVNTAKAMNDAAGSLGAKFALALGDNFYYHGVTDVSDSRFQSTFEQPFSGENISSSKGFRFHVLAGNHDHYGNVQAQVDYTGHSERWSFPDLYYTFTESAPDGATVQFVMIDTVVLAGNSQVNMEDTNSLKGSELPGPPSLKAAQSQLEWLDKTLNESTADYLIVSGHYPVYSAAEHGPTSALQPTRFPYLQKHRVSAYFCGHDHSEQHIDTGDGVQYHVIGNANFVGDWAHLHTLTSSEIKFKALTTNGAYATVSVNKTGLVVKHFDGRGSLLYTAPAISPRGSRPSPPAPAPAPAGTWECISNKISHNMGLDVDLHRSGADIKSCEQACSLRSACSAIYWHKIDSHCHLILGAVSYDQWTEALSDDSSHDACFWQSYSDVVV